MLKKKSILAIQLSHHTTKQQRVIAQPLTIETLHLISEYIAYSHNKIRTSVTSVGILVAQMYN